MVFSRMRIDFFRAVRCELRLAAVRAGFRAGSELRHGNARPFSAASDMLSCLARFAAMLERHARRSSVHRFLPVGRIPAVLSISSGLAARPADIAIVAE
jgi:hypothetical protein